MRHWCRLVSPSPFPCPRPSSSSSSPLFFNLKGLISIFQVALTFQWCLLLYFAFLLFFSLPCLSSGSVVCISLFGLSIFCFIFCFPFPLLPVTLSDSLQMDVVSAFQSGTSFQGALRRQASNSSQQQHDVTNVSSPTHVAFSTTTTTTATAVNSASATVGCECVFSSSA